ncbi:hypothetical protein AJ78_02862 [Emergomyces pasteurianus Ep9510]|uniref:G-protein coupled receptors family 2 profile 2 domain-containing protein n=1 Tax=Emergomyces pasteurianus Ep9510 TaxID=1447872 RepID=A0A1J9PMB3_9EURO|nr:hypothetical protein AJ78_02862 [Emergomyces pasteurianus Ep9510]
MSSSEQVALSQRQLHVMESSARAMSAVSITASFFVIASFLGSNLFRTPVNRAMFYATWGNVLANTGTMIGRAGISRGDDSGLCRCQAFLLQWFLPTNSLWIFCMAFNVYLTLSHRYRPSDLKRLEWRYFIICYLIPFAPALTFLFVQTKANGPVYGNAVLWCWIRPEWKAFRFAFFFGPIWLLIIITISILLYEGIEILSYQRKTKKLSIEAVNYPPAEHHQRLQCHSTAGARGIPPSINVTATARQHNELGDSATAQYPPSSRDTPHFGERATRVRETTPSKMVQSLGESSSGPQGSAGSNVNLEQSPTRSSSPYRPGPTATMMVVSQDESPANKQHQRTPVLKATTVFEANDSDLDEPENRTSWRRPHTANLPDSSYGGILLEHFQPSNSNRNGGTLRTSRSILKRRTLARRKAAYIYMKRVALFLLSLLITWIPSTINRIHRLSHPEEPVFAFALAASSVLSLQGFLNLLVYISTSLDAVKAQFITCRRKFRSPSEV